jgi:hypothetical protein
MPNSLTGQPLRVAVIVVKAVIWAALIVWIANLPVRPAY